MWKYSVSKQELISPQGTIWKAVSGPHGNGSLPIGNYTIGKLTGVAVNNAQNIDFKDGAGDCWWCPITPMFATSRSKFGIHPDGGISGTKGCIGLTAHDTSDTRRALSLISGEILCVSA